MAESKRRAIVQSSENIRTNVPRNIRRENSSLFGRAVRGMWPDKPALNLAQRAGLTERGAQYLIDGKRKPSLRAVYAVNAAFLEFD